MASNVPDEPSNGPGEPSNVPGEPKAKGETSLQSKFEAQRNKLEEIVESRFGLLSLLWSSKALTPTDQEEIEGKYTTKSKNQKLLDLISEKGNYQEFIDALRGSGQTHVVNWINGNGVYKPKFDLDWPLTDKEIDILDCNYNWLGEVLGLKEGLNGTLFSRNVINVRQRDFISSKPTSCEANEAFLKTLRQSSLKIYYLTAHCLRDLNDGHIATVLENVTATVPIHVTLVGESVVETEEQILDEVVKLRLEKNASLEEGDMDIFLARLRLRLIAARKGSSIVLFVSCFNIGEFHHLCTKVDKSEMKKILERLFNLLLQNLKPRVLLVTITESDRDNAEKLFEREFLRDKRYDEHFQRLRSQLKYEEPMELTTGESVEESEGEELTQGSEDLSTPAFVEGGGLISRTLNSLSTVLTSAVRLIYHWYFPFATSKRVKYRNAQEPMKVITEESVGEMEDLLKISELCSTSASAEGGPLFQLALQLLKELRLQFYMSKADEPKEEFYLRHKHRPMKEFYSMRRNIEFFTEHIKTNKTISKLASLQIQKDDKDLTRMLEHYERLSMREPEIMSDINKDIIFISASSYKVYCKFIKCLRETDQRIVANVAEKGGATAKTRIILEPMENIADIEKEIVAKLTQLHEANSPKSEDLWLLLSQLKIGGIEVLSAHYDEGIAVWIWCRLESTVAKLEQLDNDKKLGNLFSALFRCLPVSTVPKISEIRWHCSQFAVANRKLCKWWVKTSATMAGQKISGMAMMRNRIIISFQNRSAFVIFTFDKEGNAIHEKDETFTEIKTPMHLASSLNLQCLYITDHTSNNIYQVNIDPEGKVDEPILLLEGSSVEQINSVSVGRNDNLLVLKEGEPSRLEIYDKKARKLSQLELPTQIRYPNNAVEASNGDFVISYRSDLIPSGICRINDKGVWVSRSDLDFKCSAIPGLSEDEDSVVSSLSEGISYLKHLDHFTLDDKDQVYACSADQCVVLLDSELNMEGTVEFKDLKNPYKIHYSKDEKELLLVHGSDQDSFSVLSSRFKIE